MQQSRRDMWRATREAQIRRQEELMQEDPLDPARGIIFAALAGAALWALIAVLIYVWRFVL